ncbi:MAG: hypothetical protein ABII00_14005 [Elusimicrobiota bacterium]
MPETIETSRPILAFAGAAGSGLREISRALAGVAAGDAARTWGLADRGLAAGIRAPGAGDRNETRPMDASAERRLPGEESARGDSPDVPCAPAPSASAPPTPTLAVPTFAGTAETDCAKAEQAAGPGAASVSAPAAR